MTPLEIHICIHYHSSCEDLPWVVSSGAPIVDETMNGLMGLGLITMGVGKRTYSPTEKLHAFVHMLCATPLPEQRTHFYDPRDNSIVERTTKS